MANMQTPAIHDPVPDELRKRVEDSGSQKAVADELGISAQHLGDILRGRRTAGPALLEKLGFARVTMHVKTNTLPDVVSAIDDVIKENAGSDSVVEKKTARVSMRDIALAA
jgi:transcriptional regulator with XRE-family HTH domain